MDFHSRTWVEINLSALASNVSEIRRISPGKEIIAVVKANAYGHGDDIICPALVKLGVNFFAVSCFNEAAHIQPFVENSEILIFGFTEKEYFKQAAENNFILTVGALDYARELSEYMSSQDMNIRIHIKINTGMNRVGINTKEELEEILLLPGLRCEAVFTHFSSADGLTKEDMQFTIEQQGKLFSFIKCKHMKVHSQNSGGILVHPNFIGDYIRTGLAVYGYSPNSACELPFTLSPVMSLKSTICQLRTLEAGDFVSYGRTYKAVRKRLAAVIPAGYADGYSRAHSNSGLIAVKNNLCPVIGRVCMDQLMIDVSGVKDVKVGDIAELYSANYKETNVEFIAEKLGTIPYEVTCAVSHRVKRIPV